MGIHDRDYYRDPPTRRSPGMNAARKPRSAIFIIIVMNVAIWLANAFLFEDRNRPPDESSPLTNALCLRADTIKYPLEYYRFITHGFVHSENNSWHIIGNMMVLFFLGPAVEGRLGKRGFMWFYLLAIIAGGVFWCATTLPSGQLLNPRTGEWVYPLAVGASGGVTAVLVLFAIMYPHAKLMLLFPPIPMPAWLLGTGIILLDIYGTRQDGSGIAHTAHLGGAAFAFLYYFVLRKLFLRLTGRLPGGGRGRDDFENSRLRVYRNDSEDSETASSRGTVSQTPADDREFLALKAKVEAILQKIMVSGMDSLSEDEKKTLMDASQKYQDRRR